MTRFPRSYANELHVAQQTRRAVQPYSVATAFEEAEAHAGPLTIPDDGIVLERVCSDPECKREHPYQRAKADAERGHEPSASGHGHGAGGGAASSPPFPTLTDAAYERDVRRSKYHNVKTDGYASKREAKRAKTLYALQAAKVIANLRKQVPYVLIPRQLDAYGNVAERACTYVADFVYDDLMKNETVVEDCKGVRTADYIIKRKLMRFIHGVVVRET